MPEIRIIKIVVGVMTLMIFVMAGFAIYGISRKSMPIESRTVEAPGPSGIWIKALPAGSQIVTISAAGPSLAVLADTPQGRVIYLADPKTGEIRGTFTTAP